MDKKLLYKIKRSYIVFSVAVFLFAIPMVYFLSQWFYMYQTDKILLLHKKAFTERNIERFSEKNLLQWNTLSHDVQIIPSTKEHKDSLFTNSVYDPLSGKNELYRELHTSIKIDGENYTYVERNHLSEAKEMAFSLAAVLLVIVLVLLLGITFFFNKLAHKIWSPFYETITQIQNFNIDKSSEPNFGLTDIEEFNYLNRSIADLINKNKAIFGGQKEFTENAAHELQTPLALIQNKLDTLLQETEVSEKQSLLIEAISGDLSRMHRMSKNLLLLANIENEAYFVKQALPIKDFVTRNISFFNTQAGAKGITIDLAVVGDITVEANPSLLEILLNNLYSNAIRHTEEGGRITVALNYGTIYFSNTGNEKLDTKKLFKRFSKSNASGKGSGLGLAIVRRITEVNNWTVNYSFTGGMHHFVVNFERK